MAHDPTSRVESILHATINGTPYDGEPQSRVEYDLLELKKVIEAGGGGGGGTTDYNALSNKPTLNGVTIEGNLVSKDVKVEGDYNTTYDPDDETIIISQDMLNNLINP